MRNFQMKKLAVAVAAVGAVALSSGVANAATNNSTFNVNITLTSVCTVTSPTNVVFTYTSGGALANATGGSYSVTCTNTLPYNVSLQSGTGGAYPGLSPSISVLDNALNVTYQLTTTGPTTAGGGTGNGAAQNYVVGGTIAAGQQGTCATATCTQGTNNVHTLWVNY